MLATASPKLMVNSTDMRATPSGRRSIGNVPPRNDRINVHP
jgi:hypothetical protein